jgi:shikimate kinase/3-dehydroquinate synthase
MEKRATAISDNAALPADLKGPIFLTGFMATGKTKIGRLLAGLLDWTFIDTDASIVERANKSISDIFSTDGESTFRALEHAALLEACSDSRTVVALGGGAILEEGNRQAIKTCAGTLVCLEADVDTILERVSRKDNRPLLAGLSDEQKRQKIENMLADRAPYYATAHITFRSDDNDDAKKAAHRLLVQLENHACTA